MNSVTAALKVTAVRYAYDQFMNTGPRPVRNDFPVIDQFHLVLVKLLNHYTNFERSRFFDKPKCKTSSVHGYVSCQYSG